MDEIHVGSRTERKNMQVLAFVLLTVILALAVYYARTSSNIINLGG